MTKKRVVQCDVMGLKGHVIQCWVMGLKSQYTGSPLCDDLHIMQ